MHYSKRLVSIAKDYNLPILCGVSSAKDFYDAIIDGVHALKCFPATLIRPQDLIEILREVKQFQSDNRRTSDYLPPIYVAGSVASGDYYHYLKAGASSFAIGCDLQKDGMNVQYAATMSERYLHILQELNESKSALVPDL